MGKRALSKKPAGSADILETQSLTAENLSKLGTLDLLDKFKKGNISEVEVLKNMTPADTQKLCKRFAYARQCAEDEVQQSWDHLDKLPRGGQKQMKKKQLRFAWVKDPKFGQSYMNTLTSIAVSKDKSKLLNWVSWHQIKTSLGEEEAKAIVKSGPSKSGRTQLTRGSISFSRCKKA